MKDKKLTEKQRQFAADNHYVLENFLRYRGLPMDEFYDVVIFRFLKAVQQYDEREDLQKYKFFYDCGVCYVFSRKQLFCEEKTQRRKGRDT